MSPNDADRMANSVDTDQTAPLWVCTVCPGISVRKLWIIMVCNNMDALWLKQCLILQILKKTFFFNNENFSSYL